MHDACACCQRRGVLIRALTAGPAPSHSFNIWGKGLAAGSDETEWVSECRNACIVACVSLCVSSSVLYRRVTACAGLLFLVAEWYVRFSL